MIEDVNKQNNSIRNHFVFKPEDELQYISMTEELEQKFSPEKKGKNKLDIEPWQDEQENPSESPQRRGYLSRPSLYNITNNRNSMFFKPVNQTPTKCLPTNNNSSFKLRLQSNRPRCCGAKAEPQNKTISRIVKKQSLKKRERSTRDSYRCPYEVQLTSRELEAQSASYKTALNTMVYPILNQNKRKKLFRKLQKFQNFVSVSLRK